MKKGENKKQWNADKAYRDLSEAEIYLLFTLYEKYGGNINQLILDKDAPFRAYPQTHYYCKKHDFKNKLLETRIKRAENVLDSLQDAKNMAIENAMRILRARNVFVYKKDGTQVFDDEGNPLIVENLPFYKEIKTAWEIIKTELGEPTYISKNNLTNNGKEFPTTLQIEFVDYSQPQNHDNNDEDETE